MSPIIKQIPISASYPDHLSLSAWMCFMGAIQSTAVTLFLEQDPEAWKMSSSLQLGCCFFAVCNPCMLICFYIKNVCKEKLKLSSASQMYQNLEFS